MWYVILLVIFVRCAQCQCSGYTIVSADVSDSCDCIKIVSETAYRGGATPEVISTNAVLSSWNSSTGDCIGCYTDPNGDFGDELFASSNFSEETTGCVDTMAYSAYSANVSASMADDDLSRISFADCASAPGIAPSDSPAPGTTFTQVAAPAPGVLSTPDIAPSDATAQFTAPAPNVTFTQVAAPAPGVDETPDTAPSPGTALASEEPASVPITAPAPGVSPTTAPTPQRGNKNKPSTMWIIILLLVSILGMCHGQNVVVYTTTGECAPAQAPAPVPVQDEETSTAGGSSSQDISTAGGSSSSSSGSNSFSTSYAISRAIRISSTIRDSSYGE